MLLAKTSVNAHANDFWWLSSDTCWWLSSDTCWWLSSNDLHMHLQWISNTFAKTLSDDSRLMLCKRLLSDALQKTFVWWLLSMLLANAHSQMLSTNALANAFRKWSSLFAITVLMIVKCIRKWFSMTVYALSKCLLIQCLAHVRRLRTVSNDHRSKGLSKLHSFSLLQLLT